jgi:hypothetical protein
VYLDYNIIDTICLAACHKHSMGLCFPFLLQSGRSQNIKAGLIGISDLYILSQYRKPI